MPDTARGLSHIVLQAIGSSGNGHALDWPTYSKDAHAAAQAQAKREGWGMWGGKFVEPWVYRACIVVRAVMQTGCYQS